MKDIHALILAAGKGTRMGGTTPKVMVEASGKPLIHWVIGSLNTAGINSITAIVGYKKEEVIGALPEGCSWVEQKELLGTGHAVMAAKDALKDFDGIVLVTCGDMPLIKAETFKQFVDEHINKGNVCTVLTARIAPPHRYGRIVRDGAGDVKRIVEAADATEEELAIDEVNTGVYAFNSAELFEALANIRNDNNQGEYYLTDVLEIIISAGKKAGAVVCGDSVEALGVNSPDDLKVVEGVLAK